MNKNTEFIKIEDILDLNYNYRKIIYRKITSFILIMSLLIVSGFSFLFNFGNKYSISGDLPNYDPSLSKGIIPGMGKEEIEKILQQSVDESMFSFQINSKIEFDNGSSSSNLLLGNPPNNAYDFYVEIVLDDTNELLYKSGRIPPNHYIEHFNLNKDLPKGNYEATAYFNIYDKSGESIFGKSAAGLDIIINS